MRFGNDLGSGLGAEMQAYLDKTLLTNISENTIYDRYATIQKSPTLRNSKRIEFRKWIRMSDLYFANNINENWTGGDTSVGKETLQNLPADAYQDFVLEEGSSGTSKATMKRIKLDTNVFVIGDWMPHTEEMEMFDDMWTVAETAKQMGEMAGLVIDSFYRDMYTFGAGHTQTPAGDITTPDYTAAVRRITLALRLSGAKYVNSIMTSSPNYGTVPVRAKYVQVMHTVAAEALKYGNDDFIPLEKYKTGNEMEGEEGIIGETVVIASPQAPIKEIAPGQYECVTHIFGKDHTAHVPVRGKGSTEFIYQPLGSGGTSDALKRVGTTGWKSWLGAKTLYPERLGTITVTVNY